MKIRILPNQLPSQGRYYRSNKYFDVVVLDHCDILSEKITKDGQANLANLLNSMQSRVKALRRMVKIKKILV